MTESALKNPPLENLWTQGPLFPHEYNLHHVLSIDEDLDIFEFSFLSIIKAISLVSLFYAVHR
jgi:hypothetical protein